MGKLLLALMFIEPLLTDTIMVHPFSKLETEHRKQNTGNRTQETALFTLLPGIDKPLDVIEEY